MIEKKIAVVKIRCTRVKKNLIAIVIFSRKIKGSA
jgi:hypothetical protein